MARGDVYSDAYISVAAGATVDVQPAAGVEVMITQVITQISAGNAAIRGKDSAGNVTGNLYVGVYSSETAPTTYETEFGLRKRKFMLKNSDFIQFYFGYAGYLTYFGFQTK
jgi:hypothetical protein